MKELLVDLLNGFIIWLLAGEWVTRLVLRALDYSELEVLTLPMLDPLVLDIAEDLLEEAVKELQEVAPAE